MSTFARCLWVIVIFDEYRIGRGGLELRQPCSGVSPPRLGMESRFGTPADYNSTLMARCLAEVVSNLVPPLQNGEGCRELLRPYALVPGRGFRKSGEKYGVSSR